MEQHYLHVQGSKEPGKPWPRRLYVMNSGAQGDQHTGGRKVPRRFRGCMPLF
jgi:hypothetical protein